MKLYSAKVITNEGKQLIISEEAISKELFEDSLNKRGFYLVEIKESAYKSSFFIVKKLSRKFLIDFSYNVYSLLDFGIDINEVFKILSDIYINKQEIEFISEVISQLKKGEKLSNALKSSKYSEIFDDFIISMIASGEQSGNLKDSFLLINNYLKNSEKIKEKIISASIYPAMLVFLGIAAFHLLLFFVLPRFTSIYEALDFKPSFLIKTMMNISDFLLENFLIYLICIIAVIISLVIFFRTKISKDMMSYILLRLPVISKVFKMQSKIKVSFSLELMLKGGAKLEEALTKLNELESNEEIKKQFVKSITNLKEGHSVRESFKNIKIFDLRDLNLIEISDSISRTEEGFKKIYQDTNELLDNYLDKVLKMIEPVIMIFIGLFIFFVMYLVISPTKNLMESMNNF